MARKKTAGGISSDEVEAHLPKTYFVMRGDIRRAFGFTKTEIGALIEVGVFVAKYPFGTKTRARFVRTQVVDVAQSWGRRPAA